MLQGKVEFVFDIIIRQVYTGLRPCEVWLCTLCKIHSHVNFANFGYFCTHTKYSKVRLKTEGSINGCHEHSNSCVFSDIDALWHFNFLHIRYYVIVLRWTQLYFDRVSEIARIIHKYCMTVYLNSEARVMRLCCFVLHSEDIIIYELWFTFDEDGSEDNSKQYKYLQWSHRTKISLRRLQLISVAIADVFHIEWTHFMKYDIFVREVTSAYSCSKYCCQKLTLERVEISPREYWILCMFSLVFLSVLGKPEYDSHVGAELPE